jgi:hypothetical protein
MFVFMLKRTLLLFAAGLSALASFSQSSGVTPGKWYMTGGGEWIFSTALLDVRLPAANGGTTTSDKGSIIRFSPVFNAQGVANYDFSSKAGMFLGLSIRNVGFIYDVPIDSLNLRYKFRTYNLGIPIGFKVGNMNGGLFFFGYEPELVLNYKEKRFENEEKKEKFNVWFSDRTDLFAQSFMAGFQFANGACLKVKYYFTNFHNQDFTESETANGSVVVTRPYDGFNANVLYVSLGFGLFKVEDYGLSGGAPPRTAFLR